MSRAAKSITIIGAKGMLGYAASKFFEKENYRVLNLTRSEYDIATEPFEKFCEITKSSDIILNCAGIIKPRIPDMSIEDILRVNSIFPKNLALFAKSTGMQCFHITTDCVYSGKKGNYSELDNFDAEDIYGMTKNAGENSTCMVIRTSIIGEEKNQSRSLLEWAKSQRGTKANGFVNHKWNGVTTLYLSQIIHEIIEQGLYEEGTYHFFSPERVTKYQLLNTINEVYELKMDILRKEAEQPIDRTLSSIFDKSKTLATKNIRDQVRELKSFFNN